MEQIQFYKIQFKKGDQILICICSYPMKKKYNLEVKHAIDCGLQNNSLEFGREKIENAISLVYTLILSLILKNNVNTRSLVKSCLENMSIVPE